MNKQDRCLVILAPDMAVDFVPFGESQPVIGRAEIKRMTEANGVRVIRQRDKSEQALVVEVLVGGTLDLDEAVVIKGLKDTDPKKFVYIKLVRDQLRRGIERTRGARNHSRRGVVK